MAKKKRNNTAAPASEVKPDVSHQRLYTVLGVIILMVIAALVRDIYLLQYRTLPYYSIPALDAEYYDVWAQRVVAGKGYGPMPFYMAPFYPYFLALVYKLAGHSYPVLYSIQEGLGLLNLLLVYFLGRRVFGHVPALVAMGLMLLYGPVMYLESKVLSETLGITLMLASLILMVRAFDKPAPGRLLVAGIVLGLSALCRPAVLVFVGLVLLWMLLRWKSLGLKPVHAAVLAAGIAIAVAPVTIRNVTIGKGLALISTNSGIVFAQANNPHAIGIEMPMPGFSTAIESQQAEEMRFAARALGHRVTPAESSSYWLHQGLRFIREHPGQYLSLLGRKLIWSLHNREPGSSYNINFERRFVFILRLLILPFAVFSGFGLYGFIRDQRRETELLGLQALSVLLGLLIFSISSRYRVPMVPALSVLAGYGIMQVVERRQLVLAAACVIPMFLVSLVPYPIPAVMPSEPGNLGVAYVSAGDVKTGTKYLNEALEMNPNSSLAHLNMGLALTQLGRLDEANSFYRKGLEIEPNDERLHFYLANNLLMVGQAGEAAAEYKKALEINPDSAEAHVALGAAYSAMDMTDEAKAEFETTLKLQPDMPVAHYSLAWVYYQQRNYTAAWREMHMAQRLGWKPDVKFLTGLQRKMPDPGE